MKFLRRNEESKRSINSNTFLLFITIGLFAAMYIAGMIIFEDKGFAKPQMFLNLFISNAGLLVIAVGQTIVMITGGIDISVGSVTALVCMAVANQMEHHGMNAYMAVLLALFIGVAYGVVQGFLISYLEIQPFIVSLAGLFFGRGLTSMISTEMISIKNKTFLAWANYKIYLPIGSYSRRGKFLPAYIYPTVIIALLIVIIVAVIMKYTKFGREVYAVGGNEEAAKLSGVNVIKTKYIAYIFCGICAAIAGMIMLASLGSAEATAGQAYETNAIAAAAIGGTRMAGGKGTALGTFIGALMLAVLKVGMVVINVDSFWQFVVTGIIIIVASYFEFIQQDIKGFVARHKKAAN